MSLKEVAFNNYVQNSCFVLIGCGWVYGASISMGRLPMCRGDECWFLWVSGGLPPDPGILVHEMLVPGPAVKIIDRCVRSHVLEHASRLKPETCTTAIHGQQFWGDRGTTNPTTTNKNKT
jgi:hypothetical protein